MKIDLHCHTCYSSDALSSPYNVIKEALSLVFPELHLAIQSVIMATDTGHLEPADRVLSLTKLSCVDIISSNERLLFHPEKGLKVQHVVCRP